MDTEKFFTLTGQIYPCSAALRAYLNVAFKLVELQKNTALVPEHNHEYPLSYVEKGNLKTVLRSKVNPEHQQLRFHFENSLITRFSPENNDDYLLGTYTLSYVRLICVPKNHIYNLYRFFPEFHVLIEKIREQNCSRLLHALLSGHTIDISERLKILTASKPDIFQIASVNDVAAFMGIHPHTLSSVRNKPKSGL
ncbi:MAG: hypothetical protein EOO01_01930 [Chitinophagaceae bacterium]|nr:MAG: hypothetical protein EOO01_01930 [Chitinophagaceae bacterium]